ncbi:MAG: hypothetical protein IJ532_00780 [Alphaproteobacteria bacterium]|nr:hypothetical protein [Alphaproteobacteria bacterium]
MVNNIFIYGIVEHVTIGTNRAYLRFKSYKKVRFSVVESVSKVIEVHFTDDNLKRNRKELMTLKVGDKVEVNAKKKNEFPPAYIVTNQTTKNDCTPITDFL